MKLAAARIAMRVVGTLAGLLGISILCIEPFMVYHAITERSPWAILFAAFPLALAAYGIYIAWLVWFRFSPLAVRHICGALGFYVLTLTTRLFEPVRESDATWPAFAFLGCLVVVYFAYRVASDRLSRLLFPAGISGVQS